MGPHLIVLAAGQGTRMKSDRPKVLHEIGGAPLLAHALASADSVSPARRIVVVGHGGDEVTRALAAFAADAETVEQAEQRGTGHAVLQAEATLAGGAGDVLVLYGDTPFIGGDTLARMAARRGAGADLVVLGFEARDPGRYGRLIVAGDRLEKIVEWKDASEQERRVKLCNSGVMMADAGTLFHLLHQVGSDNAAGEIYLTDAVGIARAAGLSAEVVICDEQETLGVNSRADLAAAEAVFQARARAAAMAAGVTLTAPETVFFSADTTFGRDVVVEPNVVFGPGVRVDDNARIRAFSHLEACSVGAGAVVGPYARLRPGAALGKEARVGNFCEVKNAEIGAGAKVNHLSYVGDATVGARTNIGAGTVTCNYDGVFKHKTEIGEDAFIGSDTMLVAPVRVGDRAMTATGSVITRDVADGALAISRARQEVKPGFAVRLFDRLRAAKAAKKGK